MNTPESNEGNIVRYAIYLVAYFILIGINQLAINVKGFNAIWGVLFMLLALGLLYFYIIRFNRENRYFQKNTTTNGLLRNYGAVMIALVLIVAIQILISYGQTMGKIPSFNLQKTYLKHATSGAFWFLIIGNGLIISALQQFLTNGFFFNYWFRNNEKTTALLGVVVSGVLYAVLNFPGNIVLLIIEIVIGSLLAWSYLYTQTMLVPIILAMVSSTLMFVLF